MGAPEEYERKAREIYARTLAAFPFERITTTGLEAFARWQELKTAGRGIPLVIGDENSLQHLAGPWFPDSPSVVVANESLERATHIRGIGDLVAHRAEQLARAQAHLTSLGLQPRSSQNVTSGLVPELSQAILDLLKDFSLAPIPEPPTDNLQPEGLTLVRHVLTQEPLETVYILLIPTDDWTTIPAHLSFGGWNDCPPPEFHVAALRSWRDRYGAELIGLNSDTMNLKVSRRPESAEEALALAQEMYVYCPDLVDQGAGKVEALVAPLLSEDWWFFWWD